jgi:hypothetical protein
MVSKLKTIGNRASKQHIIIRGMEPGTAYVFDHSGLECSWVNGKASTNNVFRCSLQTGISRLNTHPKYKREGGGVYLSTHVGKFLAVAYVDPTDVVEVGK